jgi:transposase
MRACRERTDASSRPEIHAAVAQENLTLEGALRTLLRANKRLNTARLLTESFDQLWSYKHESWAWRFFDKWRASLKLDRLKAYEKLRRHDR